MRSQKAPTRFNKNEKYFTGYKDAQDGQDKEFHPGYPDDPSILYFLDESLTTSETQGAPAGAERASQWQIR